jgi:hypothetical protein
MSLARFEPAIPATKPLQTYALDRTATGIGLKLFTSLTFTVHVNYNLKYDVKVFLSLPELSYGHARACLVPSSS